MGRRKGFTLIELLVVIAIIAILAAILFPVFMSAKARAQQASCAQNMKQISVALQIYLGNWDDTYPMNRYRDTAVGSSGRMDASRFNWKSSLSTCMKTKGDVWRCPANFNRQLQDETGQGVSQTYAATAYPRSYALNGDYFNRLGNNYDLKVIKVSSISRPTKLIFILESRFGAPDLNSGMIDSRYSTWESNKKGKGWINIHQGYATNFVFADTHVQSMKVASSLTPQSFWYDRPTAEMQLSYNELSKNLPIDCTR